MRNVWFLPSSQAMIKWLQRCGFKNVKLIDETATCTEEQRTTEWMQFHSLTNFLDPNDSSKTIEGYDAPLRAIFTAEAPQMYYGTSDQIVITLFFIDKVLAKSTPIFLEDRCNRMTHSNTLWRLTS